MVKRYIRKWTPSPLVALVEGLLIFAGLPANVGEDHWKTFKPGESCLFTLYNTPEYIPFSNT